MTAAPPPKKRRLGEILIDAGVLTDPQLKTALGEQRKWGGKLGRTLIELGFVDEQTMVLALSRQLHVPAVDLDKATVSPDVLAMLDVDTAMKYGVIPIGGDKRQRFIHVATSEPGNMDMIQELSFKLGLRVQVSVASELAVERATRKFYYGDTSPAAAPMQMSRPGEMSLEDDSASMLELSPSATSANQRGGGTSPNIAVFSGGNDPLDFGLNLEPPPAHRPDQLQEALAQVKALTDQLAAMETKIAGQTRAIRVIVELMLEKRVISRDEYLAKMKSTPVK